jgi:hypothetical protein
MLEVFMKKMKKQIFVISALIVAVLLSAGGVFAQQDKMMKKEGMNMMAEMQKDAHHSLMMAHRQSVLTFAKTLREMAQGGKLEDAGLARNAFAEIKRGVEKMEEIHQSHLNKLSAEMREKMKPMMEKMQTEQAALREHLLALEKALQANAPDAREVEKHAAALVAQFEKMGMSDKKMDTPGKMKM